MTPTIGSLFTGYGGVDLAAEQFYGARTIWTSDIDPGACSIIRHRFPEAPNLGDITGVDWTQVEHPDILTGGFPCQDVSSAGKRVGMSGARSGLWALMADAIRELKPQVVIIENVRGLLSADGEPWHDALSEADREVQRLTRVVELLNHKKRKRNHDRPYVNRKNSETHRIMGQRKRALARFKQERRLVQRAIGTVLGDLADLGFDAEWRGLRAADVGAPHGRFRVFIVARPAGDSSGVVNEWRRQVLRQSARDTGAVGGTDRLVEDADRATRSERRQPTPGQTTSGRSRADAGGRDRTPVALLPTPDVPTGGEKLPDNVQWLGNTAIRSDGTKVQVHLSAVVENLLPTPRSTRGGSNTEMAYGFGGTRSDADRVQGEVLLPTPRASDGDKGGPNQRGSSGDLMLPSAVHHLLPTPVVNDMGAGKTVEAWDEWTGRMKSEHGNGNGHGKSLEIEAVRLLPTPTASDFKGSTTTRRQPGMDRGQLDAVTEGQLAGGEWGKYAPAIRRWEALTRPAPPPTAVNSKGNRRLNPALVEWMMGLPEGWVTAPELGLTWNEQLKALGNGVVPQQALAALKLID